mmetsp:Transcript_98799/g.235498  ORF Transcript_98799/g.235498 Transcript_98799/m.235498 type:complete len:261 (+) Transcript_98799:1140-1922(+)
MRSMRHRCRVCCGYVGPRIALAHRGTTLGRPTGQQPSFGHHCPEFRVVLAEVFQVGRGSLGEKGERQCQLRSGLAAFPPVRDANSPLALIRASCYAKAELLSACIFDSFAHLRENIPVRIMMNFHFRTDITDQLLQNGVASAKHRHSLVMHEGGGLWREALGCELGLLQQLQRVDGRRSLVLLLPWLLFPWILLPLGLCLWNLPLLLRHWLWPGLPRFEGRRHSLEGCRWRNDGRRRAFAAPAFLHLRRLHYPPGPICNL